MLDKKKIREILKDEVKRVHDTKDAGYSKSVIDPAKLKAAGLKQWKVSIGDQLLDVLFFQAGEHHPEKSPGDYAFVVRFMAHTRLGPNNDSYVCMSQTFRKPCYPCQVRSQISNKEDKTKEDEALMEYARARKRAAYAVWDRKNEDAGIQIMEASRYFFQDHLDGLSTSKKTGEAIAFCAYDDEEGRSIGFEIAGSLTNQRWKDFQLCERDEPIPDKIIKQIPSVDEFLYLPTYEEVKEAFEAGLLESLQEEKGEECPFGGVFGDSFEMLDECLSDCTKYEACHALYQKLEGPSESEQPKRYREEEEDERPKRRRDEDEDDSSRRSRRVSPEEGEDETPRRSSRARGDEDAEKEEDSPRKRRADEDDDRPRRRPRRTAD